MSFGIAGTIAAVIEGYAAIGLLFAVGFLPRAVVRMDPSLQGASPLVRVLILPGVAALWPLMASRWLTGTHAPLERNPHRQATTPADNQER